MTSAKKNEMNDFEKLMASTFINNLISNNLIFP